MSGSKSTNKKNTSESSAGRHNIAQRRTDKNKECLFLVILLPVVSVLFLANLGNRYLWQDEAETALVSKTILTHGIPLGYDGKNFFSQAGGFSYGENHIWVLDPWLPYYLLAAFFKIFGISTFTARLPFTLFGIATVALTYFFAKLLSRDKKTAAIATILLALSVSFLILSRQSRYYAPVAFFSLLALHGYLMLLEKNRGGSIIFLISAILVFHCNHLFCAILLVTVFTHALLCHRQQLAKVFVLSLIVGLAGLPWLIWVSRMEYINAFGYRFFNREFWVVLKTHLYNIHYYIFPIFLLLIPLGRGIFLWVKHKSIKSVIFKDMFLWKNLLLLFLFVAFTIVALSVVSPAPYFRYLTQLIPVFCVITAGIIASAISSHFRTAIAIIAILLGAVFFVDYQYGKTYPHKQGIKFLNLFDYLEEIIFDFDGPIEGIVKYLNANGSETDIVVITYGDLPLKFYTNMRIVGGLTGEDLSPAKQADWLIIRRHILGLDREVARYIAQNVPSDKYTRIVIDYSDIPWENRPSPHWHEFRTVTTNNKVVIFQKIE